MLKTTGVLVGDHFVEDHVASLVVGVMICCIGWGICVPIMTIYFLRFYRQRENLMIQKRYAICTLIIYIFVMIDTIIERPLAIMLEVGVFDENPSTFTIVLWIAVIFYSFLYFGFSFALLWKFWLLFYDINYSKESQNEEWKNLIDPSRKKTVKNQWFLTHIQTFGNFRWVTIRMSIIFIILAIISYCIWIIGYIRILRTPWDYRLYDLLTSAQTYDFLINMFILIALIICSLRIPVFYDHFYVLEELRLVFWCAIMYYGSVIIFFIMKIAISGSNNLALVTTVFAIINGFFATISQFLIVMVQTWWVLRRIDPYLHLQTRLAHKDTSKLGIADLNNAAIALDEEKYIEQTDNVNATKSDFTVNHLLEHVVGFDAFMMHLVKEFSMEHLLGYVEFSQFMDFIYHKCADIENDRDVYIPHLPSSVPYSDSITNIVSDKDYELKVDSQILSIGNLLYLKYVQQGCDLELNLSAPLRQEFIDVFENNESNDIEKILSLYSKATQEMYRSLTLSFDRFKVKRDYVRLKRKCMSDVDTQILK